MLVYPFSLLCPDPVTHSSVCTSQRFFHVADNISTESTDNVGVENLTSATCRDTHPYVSYKECGAASFIGWSLSSPQSATSRGN